MHGSTKHNKLELKDKLILENATDNIFGDGNSKAKTGVATLKVLNQGLMSSLNSNNTFSQNRTIDNGATTGISVSDKLFKNSKSNNNIVLT